MGDWIKMRAALIDHPKVIAITRQLSASRSFRDWLTPGGGGSINGQIVSDPALRCVTTALLLRVWSVARETGKFIEMDLVLEHSVLSDLDQIAGVDGFGSAMESVGWARSGGGVVLPNFIEFNVPTGNAERQREYRERKKQALHTVTTPLQRSITKPVTREEKRRVITPIVPKGTNGVDATFAEFWQLYPQKVGKKKAAEAWAKIHPDDQLHHLILAAIEQAKATPKWRKQNGEFIPDPATWLNGRRWEDQYHPAPGLITEGHVPV
jgi:hypothetical protein